MTPAHLVSNAEGDFVVSKAKPTTATDKSGGGRKVESAGREIPPMVLCLPAHGGDDGIVGQTEFNPPVVLSQAQRS